MRQLLFYIAPLVAMVITTPITGAEPRTVGQPNLSDIQVLRITGTVQLLHAKTGTVVIDDREYLLPANSASTRAAVRGAKVDFSYREAKPLPVITEMSIRR